MKYVQVNRVIKYFTGAFQTIVVYHICAEFRNIGISSFSNKLSNSCFVAVRFSVCKPRAYVSNFKLTLRIVTCRFDILFLSTAGRAYNISVQTVSEDETSAPTTAQYRTVPLRPLNVTFDKSSITSTSFRVFWNRPEGNSEFDKYQISLGGNRRLAPVTRNRDDESKWEFKDLEPGKTYQVVVKTVSGKVTSWPANGDVTLSKFSYFLPRCQQLSFYFVLNLHEITRIIFPI